MTRGEHILRKLTARYAKLRKPVRMKRMPTNKVTPISNPGAAKPATPKPQAPKKDSSIKQSDRNSFANNDFENMVLDLGSFSDPIDRGITGDRKELKDSSKKDPEKYDIFVWKPNNRRAPNEKTEKKQATRTKSSTTISGQRGPSRPEKRPTKEPVTEIPMLKIFPEPETSIQQTTETTEPQKRTNHFFVDLENVHSEGIRKADMVQQGDVVSIMYSKNAKTVDIEALSKLLAKNITLNTLETYVGMKDSLDFQLSSYLGYVIGQQRDLGIDFYIVSMDAGYDNLCKFWTTRGINVKRIHNMSGETKTQSPAPPKESAKDSTKKCASNARVTLEEVKQYLSAADDPAGVLAILNESEKKSDVNAALNEKFKGKRKDGEVYRKIKSLINSKFPK